MKNPFLFNKNRITTIVFDDIVSMCNQFDVKNIELIYEEFCAEKKTQVDENNFCTLEINYETLCFSFSLL